MSTAKKQHQGYAPEGTRFMNHPFRGELGRTRAGSPTITIVRRDPAHCYPNDRLLAECIYELASRMERLSDELNARWVISVSAPEARIVVELVDGSDAQSADDMIATVVGEFNLGDER